MTYIVGLFGMVSHLIQQLFRNLNVVGDGNLE
jgi:hypothetical protein